MSTQRKGRRKSIQNSDPGKILDLVMSLNDEACAQLQIKINTYLADECEADLVLLVVVNAERMEASIDAVGSAALQRKHKICMSLKLGDVLKSLQEQTELLSNFPPDFQAILAPYVPKDTQKRRMVMYPISDRPFSVIVCILAPKVQEDHVAILIHECFLFTWPTLKKTIRFEYECTLKQKCQQLLRVAKRLFTQVASLDTLLQIAMDQAKQLTKAEYCSVMLVDVERMELIDSSAHWKNHSEDEKERRFPLNKGIAGYVIQTGQLVNAKSAKDHGSFDADIDGGPGIDCKTILCFPIREQTGIIGVGQLINKIGDPYFDAMDEEMALAFSIYCGVCIIHSVVYQKIQEAHIRNTLANELVMYHMKVGDAEVARMLECSGFHNHPHLSSLHFNPRALPLRELPCYALKMFSDLGLDKKFNIKTPKLARFILYVKKGYRDVPYHSWLHAFNVGQWAYAAIVNYKLVSQGYFSDLQALMYVIAGLVHDLDHRGTTNSFHIHGQTTLAALYSSEGSVMERHHLAQAMCILNTEGCDILETLPRRDYDRAIMLLRDYILASDLANYFKNLNDFKAISMDYQKGNRVHATALQSLLMNAADLSDQLKDWTSVKKTAAAVLTEFFRQGDVEKSRGDLPPIIMDREKCFIPDLEIQFLQTTCIPLFDTLARIIPKAGTCVKIIENHIERWEAAKPIFSEVPTTAGLSVLLSPELDNLIELNMKEKERLRLEAEAEGNAEN
ncbi:cGMP-dependent 3',5'-cyclic phosphodiesterase-like [Ostrinia furnacalis]|uniref:cGMP-dependent 3',5'-cyclic phosphodiesterase-like n=1 Tax=Ostrinia furnacalis TaxID=93504 RepID=UPI00103B7DD1|nr:cGMP-dependent 3',5'-cyclic phosphodiesterase-like [Ostrinia furnacalis]